MCAPLTLPQVDASLADVGSLRYFRPWSPALSGGGGSTSLEATGPENVRHLEHPFDPVREAALVTGAGNVSRIYSITGASST